MDLENILVEVGLLVASFATSYFLPGISGIFAGGLIKFLTDMGISFVHDNTSVDPMFYIRRLTYLFMPFVKKFKVDKLPWLAKAEQYLNNANKILSKANNLFMDDFIKQINDPNNFLTSSGLTNVIENDIKKIEVQNKVQETLGADIVKVEPYHRIAANKKNPDSWIMKVEFQETARIGKKIFGTMIVHYCSNNKYRIGYRLVPTDKILLGRTSQGKVSRSDEIANKDHYRRVESKIDPSKVKIVHAIFEDCTFHSDYLPFLRSYSWGGYYMRKWMIGNPGSSNVISPLIFYGGINRLLSRFKALEKTFTTNPLTTLTKQTQKMGLRYVGKMKIGRKSTLSKYTNFFKNEITSQKVTVKGIRTKIRRASRKIKRKGA